MVRRSCSASALCGIALALVSCVAPPAPAAKTAPVQVAAPTSVPPEQGSGAAPPASAVTPSATVVEVDQADPAANLPASLVRDPGLYDPSGGALVAFHRKLAGLEAGENNVVRVVFFGASHVASDLFTDVVRRRLQQRFGDAGPGFVLAAKPNRWHRHGRVVYTRTRGFERAQVFARAPKTGRYGLAGVALDAGTKLRGLSALQTRAPDDVGGGISHMELYYLAQPNGGRVRVLVDGQGLSMVRTKAENPHASYERFDVSPGEHLIELRTQADGPVRLFGLALENDRAGVVVDTLGVPGARIRNQLYWEPQLFSEHLKRRTPSLVVLAYGTNEAGDDDVPIETYEARMRKVITRIKELAPDASCLLVGPTDRPVRDADSGELTDRPRTALLVATQRRVSADLGCAFFDLLSLMGGPLSMGRWVEAEPALGAPDHVHLTARGYQTVGDLLHDNLMRGYSPPAEAEPSADDMPEAAADDLPGAADSGVNGEAAIN